jgi:hypothetical protein
VPAEMTLTYPAASSATPDALRLATPAAERPSVFFDGYVQDPIPAARALLVVAKVAASRFHMPAAMIAARLDPVVTAEPDRLRFESFSQCAGVHARFDLADDGLDVRTCEPGTTNVDFNEPVRSALSALRRHEPLRLTVGWDALTVETLGGAIVERRVPLPERWVKGFGEVQGALAGALPLMELDQVGARRFLASLPGGRLGTDTAWAEPTASGARIGRRPRPAAVCVAGSARLRVLLPLARFATGLLAYGDPDADEPTTVAWVLRLPGGRLTLTLSPEARRGFSGEGGLLLDLVGTRVQEDGTTLRDAMATDARFSLSDAAWASGIAPERAAAALAWLGLHGHLGFDAYDQVYFWRHLPYPDDLLGAEPPRLRDARALAAADAATPVDGAIWRVASGDGEYRVDFDTDRYSCTCPWGARNGTSRGPCKHVLATALVRARQGRTTVGSAS